MKNRICKWIGSGWWLAGMLTALATGAAGRQLTFDEAVDIAVNRSSRGEMISGNVEVAERKYAARRVSFFVPEISVRGSIPAYSVNETYDYLPGTDTKVPGQRTTLDWNSFINLHQNLITGGSLTIRAHLRRNDWEYPQRGAVVDEQRGLGSFDITLDQPILKPSDPKHELSNRKDDFEIAKLARLEEIATLKEELTEAYFGVLQMTIHQQIAADRLESARLQAGIDSIKFAEEVLSEEDWLESTSNRLDAELEQFDIENTLATKRRDLAILLDLESGDDLELTEPEVPPSPGAAEAQRLIAAADQTVPLRKAEYQYRKARREARYQASAKGLTGTLSANFQKEIGKVETTTQGKDDLDLDTWGVRLEFDYPVWDGGAAAASVRAAELEAERTRIDYERAQKAARSELKNLIDGINVSYRKLTVLAKQVDLARSRLDIARSRLEDGQISRITYLESSVEYLESQNSYYEELKTYLIDTFTMESRFSS